MRFGKFRSLRNLPYVFAVAFMIASAVTGLIPAVSVSAHAAVISGSVVCNSDFTQTIHWSIHNDFNLQMTINSTSPDIGLNGHVVGPNGSTGGDQTISTVGAGGSATLHTNSTWSDGFTTSNSGSVNLLGKKCAPPPTPTNTKTTPTNTQVTPTNTQVTPTNTQVTPTDTRVTPTDTQVTPTNTPTSTNTSVPNYQLNLSHIQCVDGQVEIHFVLLNVPDGITPGTLTYTYGSIPPGGHTGNVWSYTDHLPDGTYDVTSASVVVGGVTVNLHNPDAYAGTYNCTPTSTSTFTPTGPTNTFTPTATSTMTPTGPTPTFTSTFTPTDTFTPTMTSTSTPTFTSTHTPTFTATSIPPRITFTYCYSLVLSQFMIKVVNSGPAGFVGYSIDGGTTINSVSIGAGATITILLPKTATTVLLYVKANSGDAWSSSVGGLELNQKNVCEEDPIVVVFTCSGDAGTPSAWQVVNKNNYDVSFTWTIVGGPSSSAPIELPALATYSFETGYFPGEMQIYVNGVLQAHAFASICGNPPPHIVSLQLDSFCSRNTGFNAWRVVNPNSVALNFEWNIDGTSLSGVGNVSGNSHVDFQTAAQGSRDTLLLYRGGVLQAGGLAANNCSRTITPIPGPSLTPSPTVPVTGTPPVLIPVTGIDLGASNIPLSHIFFNLSLGFLGLGLVLSAFGRKQN